VIPRTLEEPVCTDSTASYTAAMPKVAQTSADITCDARLIELNNQAGIIRPRRSTQTCSSVRDALTVLVEGLGEVIEESLREFWIAR
jgi:hypothetical protein